MDQKVSFYVPLKEVHRKTNECQKIPRSKSNKLKIGNNTMEEEKEV